MAGEIEVNGQHVQLWDRNTIADGYKMAQNTIVPICSAITAGGAAVSAKIQEEIDRATNKENALSGEIHDETERATNKETELDEKIDAVADDLEQEISDREDEDRKLQDQIDTINAGTDVINVYGTYDNFSGTSGDLFSTSAITDQDVVKVLNDPNQYPEAGLTAGPHQTYFRWNVTATVPHKPLDPTDGEWRFIGYTDPYYNTAEIDEKFEDISATVSNNYLSANGVAVQSGHNIVITKPDGDNTPHIKIETSSHVTFDGVSSTNVSANSLSATTLSAATAYGQSAKFDDISATNLTALTATGESAKYTNVSATNLTALTASGNLAQYITLSGQTIKGATSSINIDNLINSAVNGGAMTGLKNASAIVLNFDPDKKLEFDNSASEVNLYVSGGASEWIGFDIDGTNHAITVTGNLTPILSQYLPVNWSGYTDSIFSGTSRSAQSAGSASLANSASLAYSATLVDSARIANSAKLANSSTLANSASLANSSTYTYSATIANEAQKLGNVGSADLIGSAQSGKAAWNILRDAKISAVGTNYTNTAFANLSAGLRISAGNNLTIATAANNTIQLNAKDTGLTSISAGGHTNGTATYNSTLKLSAGDGINFVTAADNILGISASGTDYRGGNCISIDNFSDTIKFIDLSSTISSQKLIVSGQSALWQNGPSYLSADGGVVKLSIDNDSNKVYFDGFNVGISTANRTTWPKIISAGNGKFGDITATNVEMSGIYDGTYFTAYYTPSGVNLKRAGMPGPQVFMTPYEVSAVAAGGGGTSVTATKTWYELLSRGSLPQTTTSDYGMVLAVDSANNNIDWSDRYKLKKGAGAYDDCFETSQQIKRKDDSYTYIYIENTERRLCFGVSNNGNVRLGEETGKTRSPSAARSIIYSNGTGDNTTYHFNGSALGATNSDFAKTANSAYSAEYAKSAISSYYSEEAEDSVRLGNRPDYDYALTGGTYTASNQLKVNSAVNANNSTKWNGYELLLGSLPTQGQNQIAFI
ncbi:MAG: hypothetical protein J6T10_01850 [Methanobrevibacter sp.]|nr:hypothetical protein [Methanobrevibacter sp.]